MNRTNTTSMTSKPLWLGVPAWGRWGAALLFNTVIALFLTAIGFGGPFAINWLFSQCIGLTIYLGVEIALHRLPAGLWRIAGIMFVVGAGSLLGTALALALLGQDPLDYASGQIFWQSVVIGLLVGAVITALAAFRERALRMEQDLRETRLKHVNADKARVETELRLLQAQVEPHFLFNTLALLRGFITHDPEQGRRLLDHLIDYLRASLSHSRRVQTTLCDELDLLANYLAIMRLRMGERLTFDLDVPDALRSLRFPPMLLQPLVENAVRHGLEPKPGPGALTIRAQTEGQHLCIDVIDNGVGLGTSGQGGTGLANVRERLLALYDGEGRLTIEENKDGGVTASLRLPQQ